MTWPFSCTFCRAEYRRQRSELCSGESKGRRESEAASLEVVPHFHSDLVRGIQEGEEGEREESERRRRDRVLNKVKRGREGQRRKGRGELE